MPKTSRKVQKMGDLGGPTSIRPFTNTLYRGLFSGTLGWLPVVFPNWAGRLYIFCEIFP